MMTPYRIWVWLFLILCIGILVIRSEGDRGKWIVRNGPALLFGTHFRDTELSLDDIKSAHIRWTKTGPDHGVHTDSEGKPVFLEKKLSEENLSRLIELLRQGDYVEGPSLYKESPFWIDFELNNGQVFKFQVSVGCTGVHRDEGYWKIDAMEGETFRENCSFFNALKT